MAVSVKMYYRQNQILNLTNADDSLLVTTVKCTGVRVHWPTSLASLPEECTANAAN